MGWSGGREVSDWRSTGGTERRRKDSWGAETCPGDEAWNFISSSFSPLTITISIKKKKTSRPFGHFHQLLAATGQTLNSWLVSINSLYRDSSEIDLSLGSFIRPKIIHKIVIMSCEFERHYMAKCIWTPDHQIHMWVFSELEPQNLKHTIVENVFVCCRITISLHSN